MTRVHVISLPHTETIRDWDHCAYTAKTRRFCDMLTIAGHQPILYAGTRNEADCAEHVELVTDDDRARWFGHLDFTRDVFNGFDPTAPWFAHMNARAVAAIAERAEPGDVLGLIAGTAQKPIADALPHLRCIEWGIGYEGSFADFRCFESHAWQHHTYGRQGINDGRFYDTVIPNAFDVDDFIPRADHDGYLLFLGRHIPRKGTEIVTEIAKRHEVVTAGQGDPIPSCEHRGVVLGADKAKLLAGARALLAPTLYVEPFGGVSVEAQLSGTPVIATPWGAFGETVEHGRTGFLCHTLAEFLTAVERVDELDHEHIINRSRALYTLEPVSHQYDEWLTRLATLDGAGWYT